MIRAALSLALLAACSTPVPPAATGDAPASQATSTARPSEPAPSAFAQGASAPSASAPSASAAAVSSAPTAPASSAVTAPDERIPCKTVRDCWVSPTPYRHPIVRPARFKKRDFKPCVDGEAEPVCGDDGFCAIGRVAGC